MEFIDSKINLDIGGRYLVKRESIVWTNMGNIKKYDWLVTTWDGYHFTCSGTVVKFLNIKLN